jgi:hypothetical protein
MNQTYSPKKYNKQEIIIIIVILKACVLCANEICTDQGLSVLAKQEEKTESHIILSILSHTKLGLNLGLEFLHYSMLLKHNLSPVHTLHVLHFAPILL